MSVMKSETEEAFNQYKELSSSRVLSDGWRDIHKETPANGVLYDIWYNGERYTDMLFIAAEGAKPYFYSDPLDMLTLYEDVTAWRELPAPPAFA